MHKTNEFENEYNLDAIKNIEIKGFQMFITPRYIQHYVESQYEQFSSEIIKNYLKPNSVFVDVGAHYGYYSLLAHHVHKNTKIIAIEPVKENFEIIMKNMQLNKIEDYELHNIAASDNSGLKNFHITEASDSAGFYNHYLTKTKKIIKIKTIQLDEIIKNRKVDFIKIDVEGHEIPVLSGLKQTIKNNDKMVMLIEFNPELQERAGYHPKVLLKTLKNLEYDMFLIDEYSRKYIRITDNTYLWEKWISDIKKNDFYANIYCVPKKNSLFISFFSHSSYLYGAERCLLELIELVKKEGVLCNVVLPRKGPFIEELKEKAVSFDIIEYNWWTTPLIKELCVNAYAKLIKPIVSTLKIDPHLIYTNTTVIPWGAISAAFLNKPHIWCIREFGENGHGMKFIFEFKKRAKFIDFFSDRIVYISRALQNEYERYIDKNKSRMIYDSVQIPQDYLEENVEEVYHLKDSLKLIMVGSISEGKRQHQAIEALYELNKEGHKVELLIIGNYNDSNEYCKKLEKFIKNNELNGIYLKDFVRNPFPYIKKTDILLMCSKNEAFGRVTVEAMMLSKPIIGSERGGTVELIKDGFNGLLYDFDNTEDLKDKIMYFIKNKEEVSRMGHNGYEFIKEKFNEKNEIEEKMVLFKDLRNSKRSFFCATYKRLFALLLIGILTSVRLFNKGVYFMKIVIK